MINQMKELIEKGIAKNKIAGMLNLDPDETIKIIKENKFEVKQEVFDESRIEEIKDLYKLGVSIKALGQKFNIDKRRVEKWCAEFKRIGDQSRIHFFNEHYFDEIDTPTKAYWLGFFYADAYNNNGGLNLCLAQKDYTHLLKLAKLINYDEKKVNSNNFAGGYYNCNIKFNSKHLSEVMTKHGCMKAKSFIIKYPEWMPDHLHNHFIRGMFDGDGCISLRIKQKEWKWSLVSTKEGCEKIQELILKNTGKFVPFDCISNTGNNTYCMATSGNEKIRIIMNWLNKDAERENILDRKYEKYLQLIDQQNNRKSHAVNEVFKSTANIK